MNEYNENEKSNDKNELGNSLSDMAGYLSTMASQLSFFSTEVGSIRSDVNGVKVEVAEMRTEYNDRFKVLEEDEALKPYMVNNIHRAVRIHVAELLGIEFDKRGGIADGYERDYKRYFGKFCNRLHNDAKREGIEASNWKYTPRKNYPKLIEFISDWVPARGVEGLKEYYDKLAEAE